MNQNLTIFSLDNISNKMSDINAQIRQINNKPFPNKDLLSAYQYQKRPLHFNSNGGLQGSYPRLITSVIDFSFIRSIVAHTYSPKGPPCYDPPSLFLLDLFHYIDEFADLQHFLKNTLHDTDKGKGYRTYAGIREDRIPCQATFSNFRKRLGPVLYNEILHTLVEIFRMLKLVTCNILSHDGTLYHTRARYRGCTYFGPSCGALTCSNIISNVRDRILNRLNNLANCNLNKEIRVSTQCPNTFPEGVKNPKIELFSFRLSFTDHDPTPNQLNTAKLFQVEEDLKRQGLLINTIRSNVTNIDYSTGSFTIRCPKLPKDTDAKIGVRKNPKNPDKKEKIFGFNAIMSTSIELHLGLESPVACSNIAGNAEEGKYLIHNRDQIAIYHPSLKVKLDLADAKYDELDNYAYSRASGAIPIIDYNKRNEDLSKKALKARGFDEHGTPFAPCGILTKANGFDKKTNSLIYCCFHQCLKLKARGIKSLQESFDIASCPHINLTCGFTKHMRISDHPRLCLEIPRGSDRFNKIRALRSGSERTNSSVKGDIPMLDHPNVMGSFRSAVLAQMSTIVLLLKRCFDFIIKVTLLTMKTKSIDDQVLSFKQIPHYLKNMVFLE